MSAKAGLLEPLAGAALELRGFLGILGLRVSQGPIRARLGLVAPRERAEFQGPRHPGFLEPVAPDRAVHRVQADFQERQGFQVQIRVPAARAARQGFRVRAALLDFLGHRDFLALLAFPEPAGSREYQAWEQTGPAELPGLLECRGRLGLAAVIRERREPRAPVG
jgi:hypothetical protein